MKSRHQTDTLRTPKAIRIRIPKVIDLLLVSDPDQIQWLNRHPDIGRPLDSSIGPLHRWIGRRLHTDMGFGGEVLPVFLPRSDENRAKRQHQLDEALEDAHGLPGEERDTIAEYVSGKADPDDIGAIVQQWCGRLFDAHYRSSKETYEAGRLLARWPTSLPWQTWRQRINGNLDRAKRLLSMHADSDLYCIHATSIGTQNVLRSIRRLRLAAQSPKRRELPPDDILRQCLATPAAVLRGCKSDIHVPFLDHPITPQTVVVFLVARAFTTSGDLDVAFLGDDWSACPARRVIPEMLRAVWHAAHHDEAREKISPKTNNTKSRLWSWAVS